MAPRTKELKLSPAQEELLRDMILTHVAVSIAQVRRALKALRPGSRVFEKGVSSRAKRPDRGWISTPATRRALRLLKGTKKCRVPVALRGCYGGG